MVADVVFIVNPASGNGRTRRRWRLDERKFRSILRSPFDVRMTERPLHASHLCREAIRGGARTIVSVGGDGTLNEVVNGYLDIHGRPLDSHARIAVFSVGTGSDFVKTLGVPTDPVESAKCILKGATRTIDAGLCEFDEPGGPSRRFFINVGEFGSGGAVVDRVNRSTKILGGRMSFLLAILRTLPGYVNTKVTYEADDVGKTEAIVNDFIVANGRYFGGGLMPAPHANLDDGLFDVVVIGDMDFKTVRRNLPALRAGTHLTLPDVTYCRAKSVKIGAGEEMIDLDGEYVGRHPTRFECLPRAVEFIV